jgi:hypothetical protein
MKSADFEKRLGAPCIQHTLLSEYLHSHNYSEYTRLQICILNLIQATSQVYSFTFDEVTFRSLRLLHLNPFVTSISKHKISSSNILYGLICLTNTIWVSMVTLCYAWCMCNQFYLMLLWCKNIFSIVKVQLGFCLFYVHSAT